MDRRLPMKINKYSKKLIEARLFEEDEGILDATASVADIADEIKDTLETESEGETTISDAAAMKAAVETKTVADDLGMDELVIDSGYEFLGVDNKITKILNLAYKNAVKHKQRKNKFGSNVLISGLPGSGKTASVTDWAEANNINLVSINAKNNDLEAYINGYTTKNPDDPRRVTQAFSDNLDDLEKPNSVLFLDEYNRQVKPHIRASLYTLINEHKIVGDGPGRQHTFKNLLFTIAAINPSVPTDKGAAPLNDAEKSRFLYKLKKMDSDAETTIAYINAFTAKKIRDLNPKHKLYREALEDYLRAQDLCLHIVTHPNFDSSGYDTEDDLQDLFDEQRTMLNQRSLVEGIYAVNGDPDDFIVWLKFSSDFLDKDIENLERIVEEYIEPTFEELCKGAGIDITTGMLTKKEEPVVEAEPEDVEDLGDIEDDEDFIDSPVGTKTMRAKSPYEVELAITSSLADW
jgi:hypothetical protein